MVKWNSHILPNGVWFSFPVYFIVQPMEQNLELSFDPTAYKDENAYLNGIQSLPKKAL